DQFIAQSDWMAGDAITAIAHGIKIKALLTHLLQPAAHANAGDLQLFSQFGPRHKTGRCADQFSQDYSIWLLHGMDSMITVKGQHSSMSKPMSGQRLWWVKAPQEMKSAPKLPSRGSVERVTPPLSSIST